MTASSHLVVGIGNTTVKLGVMSGWDPAGWPIWSFRHEFPTASLHAETLTALPLSAEPFDWSVASVHRGAEANLREWVAAARPRDQYRCLTRADLPIEIHVEAPERVGLDRLAAAVAVNQLRARGPAVFVDAGTAITINLISHQGAFEGGVILPGFTLTAKALAAGTDQLPLVAADLNADPPPIVGKSTDAAIRSGLFWGNVGAVREIVERIAAELPEPPQLFVTGGDAQRLSGLVSPTARFIPDLVLAGIIFSTTPRTETAALPSRG